MKARPIARIALLIAASALPLGLALGTETTPAAATQDQTFTLKRGENLSGICSGIRAAGVAISTPDCVKQILFVNRQWFDQNFGYVWKDAAAVNLDSAVRLWAGVPYRMPAELVQANLQAHSVDDAPIAAAGAPVTFLHPGHFDPKGKPPSPFTIEVIKQAREALPFSDTRDFDENNKGLIAPMKDLQIMADAGHVAWDMEQYQFIDQQGDFDSIHPSLHRIAKLNNNYGLYEVVPGFYQVRGLDLAQISFVRGKRGWIALDPLVSAETARAGLKLLQEHIGEGRPVTAVIYSHDHADHWGGVRGIVEEADVRAGKVEIIAPDGFMEALVSENVFAGNAMNRRLFYQYGTLLPRSPYGYVSQGLGQGVSSGAVGLIAPTRFITKPIEEITVDGVKMVFQLTPNTEAPTEMNTWFPDTKVLWMAENVMAGLHNIYTLRGAPVRNALNWSKYLNQSLHLFGTQAEVMFAAHHWPRWGNDRIQDVLRAQRDLYANLNNQVLHLANQGVTINEIHNVYELPKSLQQNWYTRGYHGSPEHNSRGVIQRFLGFWDANPATLIPLSPSDSAPLYVEMMGGADKILARGRQLIDEGAYLYANEILNKLVQAEPQNQTAKELLADSFEQFGYQQENPGLRNSFLAGAYELRNGIPQGEIAQTAGADTIRAMSTGLWLDFLGIRMDSRQAEGMRYTINLITPDNGEKYLIELENATLTNIQGFQADKPDLTLTINRSDLEQTMMGLKTLRAQVEAGTAEATGDIDILDKIAATMVDFDPRFEILPGTKAREAEGEPADPFKVEVGNPIAE
ncbi:alkyl/aryl-sulfatase [Thiocystis violascens]|uniref:Alkyl sulfatase-like hydrolase n=1 Tax=Thiocystis violascens (strain ATCC 17096 / DSM 198 / 6111) TaxID=765911 RepID=I3Y8S8_THIV6|nr:alkyl sulfatase dimerization domain-containing protein [Thiocystis violascens]AFL73396.1 alkyl sulfatase-like hydrolase [Thiocystis violascens DSM 198]